MILGGLTDSEKYYCIHPSFKKAFDFLKRQDLKTFDIGKHEIDGKNVFAIVSKVDCKGEDNLKLEVHRKYIDIQVSLEGVDRVGYMPLKGCHNPIGEYNPDKDFHFFSDLPQSWVLLNLGQFVIFFTDDAHAPLAGTETVHKVVIKIAV